MDQSDVSVWVCEKEIEAVKRTFVQLQSVSKAKRKHTCDIPLLLGGWGSVGTRTQKRPDT